MPVVTSRGHSDKDLYNVLQALVNRANYANIRQGTVATNLRCDAFTYFIGHRALTKGATDPVDDIDAAFTNTTAGQFCKVRVEVDASGVFSGKQGPIAASQEAALIPPRSADKVTVCVIQIPASFTFNTTSYAGATFVQGDPDLGNGTSLPGVSRGISNEVVATP